MPDRITQLPLPQELLPELVDGEPFAIFVDIDSFIWVNDQFGHHVGDGVLADLASALSRISSTYEGSRLFRIGGDEFLLLLPRVSANNALVTGRAIVELVHSMNIPYRRTDRPSRIQLEVNAVVFRLTSSMISQGLSLSGPCGVLREWLEKAIYRQKQTRGNEPGVVVDLIEESFAEAASVPASRRE